MRFIEFLEMVRDRVVHRSLVGKRKLDAAFARRQLDRTWTELGERYGALVRQGRVAVPQELRGLLGRVRDLEERLREHRTEVSRLEREIASET